MPDVINTCTPRQETGTSDGANLLFSKAIDARGAGGEVVWVRAPIGSGNVADLVWKGREVGEMGYDRCLSVVGLHVV